MNTTTYWQDKLAAWLYYPVSKIFGVSVYRQMSEEIRNVLLKYYINKDKWNDKALGGNETSLGEEYKRFLRADMIASEMTRAAVPSYSEDQDFNGAVEFKKCPELKHPLVKNQGLQLTFDDSVKNLMTLDELNRKCPEEMQKNVKDFMKPITDILYRLDKETESCTDPEEKAEYFFNYLYFSFSRQLRSKNIFGLGALWDMLPSDTRIPDHSLWNHSGLTSAIYSSMKNYVDDKNINLCVYSITPVQDYISKARKLRDFWSGSVILSYLSFMGISYVMKTLGPDHIIYPSLQNQYLVDEYLKGRWSDTCFVDDLKETDSILNMLNENSSGIASFPNKFVFICNSDDVKKVNEDITNFIKQRWIELTDIVKAYISEKSNFILPVENYSNSAQIRYLCEEAKKQGGEFCKIWDNTIETFWKFSWASSGFLDISEQGKDYLSKLLTEKKYRNELDTLIGFSKNPYSDKIKLDLSLFDNAKLYGASHSFVQGLLASGKSKPTSIKHKEIGEKCPLCGEHQVLNNYLCNTNKADKDNPFSYKNNYDKEIRAFWSNLSDVIDGNKNIKDEENKTYIQIGKGERLCAVCAVKRFLPLALKEKNYTSHLLYKTLADKDSFPSTTEIALWEDNKNLSENEQRQMAQKYHSGEFESENQTRADKYYAFLLMDGDKMGELINGSSIEARWQDVLSTDLVKRFENKSYCPESPFKKGMMDKVRSINPALHSMISDSLNNFARYGVQPSFFDEKGNKVGRLIYAGGDDVCAILPLSMALKIANRIRETYTYSFAGINSQTGNLEEIKGTLDNLSKYSKIGMHLGSGAEKISISGAIIIAHHKQPLREVYKTAHEVLDGIAKGKSNRNSLAIRFMARSGGARDIWFKWEEEGLFGDSILNSFETVVEYAKKSELSASLLYSIENLRGLIEPLSEFDKPDSVEKIINLFKYEVEHSRKRNNESETLAKALANICIPYKKSSEHLEDWFNPDAAVIANFMAKANVKSTDKKKEDDSNE